MRVGSLSTIGRGWIALLLVTLGAAMTAKLPMGSASSDPDVPGTEASGGALGAVAGQLRATLAGALWLKADAYLHRGIGYRLPNADHHGHTSQRPDTDHHPAAATNSVGDACAGKETVILPPENDFRGILGDLEREIKPFALGHLSHGEEEEILPWFRMVTSLDPHNVRAYKVGAFWLYGRRGGRSVKQALDFIEEGLKHNPCSPDLFYARGEARFVMEEYQRAASDFAHALDLVEAAGTFADASQEQDMLFACRYLVHAHQRLGQPVAAIEACERGLRLFPDDSPLLQLRDEIRASLAPPAF